MNRPALDMMADTTATAASNAGLRADWVGSERFDAVLAAEWTALCANATEANVFAEPWLTLAGLQHCTNGASPSLCVVRDEHEIIGVAALTQGKRIGRSPLACSGDWSHPNAFLMAATARAGREAGFWTKLIEATRAQHRRSSALLIDGLVEGSALHRGLIDAADALGLPTATEARIVRAMLATDEDAESYWEASVRAKKRKELRRQWARLGEMGALSVDHGDSAASADRWIDEFLLLEASGWKGANRSALASNADTMAFFRESMREGWTRGQVLLTALRLDGRAIAMLITLVSGNAGFSFKTAFDEDYARFSPGVLLQRESLALLTARKLAFIDSCAAQDHPMIDSLWRERRAVVSVSLPLPGAVNRLAWLATQGAMAGWRKAKQLRHRPVAAAQKDDEL